MSKKLRNAILTILTVLFFVFIAVASNRYSPTPERVTPADNQGYGTQQTSPDSSTLPQKGNQNDVTIERDFAVGDTVRVGDIEITVLGYRFSEGESFFTPDDGNVFFLIDVAIANKGTSVESISSMLMFDLRDADGFSMRYSFGAQSMGRSVVDGVVLSGKVIRGEIGYEIPRDTTGYELQINPQVFGRSGLFTVSMDRTSDTPTNPDSLRSSKVGAEIAIGQAHASGNLEFVVNGIRMDSGSGFLAPDTGNTYLLVDVSVTNNGSEAESISSMLLFAFRDSLGFSYSSSMGATSAGRGSLDGDVMAGRTLRGELGVEVPIDTTGLELIVSPDLFRTTSVFVVSLD